MIRIAIAVNGRKQKRVESDKKCSDESCPFVKEIRGDPIRQPCDDNKANCRRQPERECIDTKNQVRDPDRPHSDRRFMQPDMVLTPPFVIVREPRLVVEREFERMFRQIPSNDSMEPFIPIGNPAVSNISQHQSTGGDENANEYNFYACRFAFQ